MTVAVVAAAIAIATAATVLAIETDEKPYDDPGDSHRRIPRPRDP